MVIRPAEPDGLLLPTHIAAPYPPYTVHLRLPDKAAGWEAEQYAPLGSYYGFNRHIHLHLALNANDQLRQRVAHALIQALPI